MIYRTYREALDQHESCSWKQKCILQVTLANGVTFFRTYVFDTSNHITTGKCKRCRKASRGVAAHRVPSSGHTCETCGNPFAGFVRQARRFVNGAYEEMRHCWSGGGRLH